MKVNILTLFFFFNLITVYANSYDKDSAGMNDIKIKEGEFYMYHQNFQRSIDIYSDLLKNDPEDALVNYRLGVCYYLLDKVIEADKFFDVADADSWYHTRILLFREMQRTSPKSLWW